MDLNVRIDSIDSNTLKVTVKLKEIGLTIQNVKIYRSEHGNVHSVTEPEHIFFNQDMKSIIKEAVSKKLNIIDKEMNI